MSSADFDAVEAMPENRIPSVSERAILFISSNLWVGGVATSYGFNVTATGIGTRVINVGANGAAFAVACV